MMTPFQQLGDTVAGRWSACNWNEDAFPRISAAALKESRLLETVEMSDVVQWFITADAVPAQYSNPFGQPPINMYVADRFYIQVIFWLDATTTIHEHDFLGAFGVLAGSSVHSQYRFDMKKKLSPDVMLGNIEFLSSELLQRGDIHEICSGDKFIHALFHLDRPSVSLVIRTPILKHLQPQYTYLKPSLAINPLHNPAPLATRLLLLDSLRKFDLPAFWSAAMSMSETKDPWMTYKVLALAHQQAAGDPHNWRALVDVASREHGGEFIQSVLNSIATFGRELKLMTLRASVHNPVHRFFLALLLNVPTREAILNLIERRFASPEPESLIVQWLGEMAAQNLIRINFDDRFARLLRLALSFPDFEDAKEHCPAENRSGGVNPEADLKRQWNSIHNIEFLKPLFPRSAVLETATGTR